VGSNPTPSVIDFQARYRLSRELLEADEPGIATPPRAEVARWIRDVNLFPARRPPRSPPARAQIRPQPQ
jgi:hypothetical protein